MYFWLLYQCLSNPVSIQSLNQLALVSFAKIALFKVLFPEFLRMYRKGKHSNYGYIRRSRSW
ncbi:MAG: hypothetical protein CLLPBCKN_001649 [Chroococcidiopsis cubana SAG 39.79]|nr:hypothetical protein [Chroococcidiopsis cubana SAG 39.79]